MTTSCKIVRSNAAGLMALAPDDPERLAALKHAQGCAECREAMEDGARLWSLLGEVPAPPPSEAVLQRVSSAIVAEMDREAVAEQDRKAVAEIGREARAGRRSWLTSVAIALAVLLSFGLLLLTAKSPLAYGSDWPWAAGLLATALALSVLVERSALLTTAAAVLVSFGFSLLTADNLGGIALPNCLVLENVAALAPLLAMIAVLRRTSGGSAWRIPGAAASGALAGQAVLHLACPGHALTHLLAFHTGGVIAAALLGLVIAQIPPLATRRAS